MKRWEDVKSAITSLNEDEKRNIEMLADIISQMIERRQEIGLSQRDLAEKCGIKQSAIARLEKMRTVPQLDTLTKLLKPLGLKLAVIPDENIKSGVNTEKPYGDCGLSVQSYSMINEASKGTAYNEGHTR